MHFVLREEITAMQRRKQLIEFLVLPVAYCFLHLVVPVPVAVPPRNFLHFRLPLFLFLFLVGPFPSSSWLRCQYITVVSGEDYNSSG